LVIFNSPGSRKAIIVPPAKVKSAMLVVALH
jgi:hypothetical protein